MCDTSNKAACSFSDVQTRFPQDLMLVDLGICCYIGVPLFHCDDAIGILAAMFAQPIDHLQAQSQLLEIASIVAEEELAHHAKQKTHELLLTALDQAESPIVITDRKGTIIYINRACERTSGYVTDDVLGRPISDFNSRHHEPECYQSIVQSLHEGKAWKGPFTNRVKGGALLKGQGTVSPVISGDKTIAYVVMFHERQKQETQIQIAQRLETAARVASGMAHDINNLLGSILAMAELSQIDMEHGRTPEDKIDRIIRTVQKAGQMTRKLLLFSSRKPGEAHATPLNALIEECMDLSRQSMPENIKIAWYGQPGVFFSRIDPVGMEQVLMNLIINARDAMKSGGSILFSLKPYTHDLTDERMSRGDYVELAITDQGHGMSENVLERAMEPFFTTKQANGGTGLGLSVCYGIVKDMGGHIDLESNEGLGTTVRLYLPRVDHEQEQKELPRPQRFASSPSILRGCSILLLEDEPLIRNTISEFLSLHEAHVTAAENLAEARRIFRTQTEIDLMLSDVILPDGDGRDLARDFKAQRPELKILFMSGHALDMKEQVITKPFSMHQLMEAIAKISA